MILRFQPLIFQRVRRARVDANFADPAQLKTTLFLFGMIAVDCTCNETDILNNSGQVNYVFLTFFTSAC